MYVVSINLPILCIYLCTSIGFRITKVAQLHGYMRLLWLLHSHVLHKSLQQIDCINLFNIYIYIYKNTATYVTIILWLKASWFNQLQTLKTVYLLLAIDPITSAYKLATQLSYVSYIRLLCMHIQGNYGYVTTYIKSMQLATQKILNTNLIQIHVYAYYHNQSVFVRSYTCSYYSYGYLSSNQSSWLQFS